MYIQWRRQGTVSNGSGSSKSYTFTITFSSIVYSLHVQSAWTDTTGNGSCVQNFSLSSVSVIWYNSNNYATMLAIGI